MVRSRRLSTPYGLAEVDIVLVGQHACRSSGRAAESTPAQDAAAGSGTRRGTGASTNGGTAQAAVELALTACRED
jgi:hypothetical protein